MQISNKMDDSIKEIKVLFDSANVSLSDALIQAKKDKCTLDALLRSKLSEIEEDNISKSLTENVLDFPQSFEYWKDFNDQMKIVEDYVKSIQEPKYTKYIQPNSDKIPIPSHHSLTYIFASIGIAVFSERIFKDVIFGFFSTPDQNTKMVARVGGLLPNFGDLFYTVKSKVDENKYIYIHLMEVKTRASLSIDSYADHEDYDQLLVNIYHDAKKQVDNLSRERVSALVTQMIDIMKSDSSRGIKKVYTLLSTYENTFVLFYDNEKDVLWISPPLSRDKLLLAMYFVLIIQLHQHGYSEGDLSDLAQRLINESPKKPVIEENMDTSNSSSSTLNSSQSSVMENDQSKTPKATPKKYSESIADSLYTIWKKGPREMIEIGRTCFVIKVSLNKKILALKMVNLFKNAKGSLKELEHENDIMRWINMNTNLSIVPVVHYYGNISAYRTLVTTYIDGTRFNDFKKMNPLMREECRKSVNKLHSCKVLHGDLEPWNFLIKTFTAKSYKAYIIDFGKAVLYADEELLEKEYKTFCKAAEINSNNTSMI